MVGLYLAIVAFAGGAGALIATFVDRVAAPRLFFLLELPPTPLGFALYGSVTIAVLLGIPLLLVVAVSRYADGEPTEPEST